MLKDKKRAKREAALPPEIAKLEEVTLDLPLMAKLALQNAEAAREHGLKESRRLANEAQAYSRRANAEFAAAQAQFNGTMRHVCQEIGGLDPERVAAAFLEPNSNSLRVRLKPAKRAPRKKPAGGKMEQKKETK